MANIRNSALLDSILKRAEALRQENKCSGLTRDYIIVAALTVMRDKTGDQDEEVRETAHLLENLSGEREALAPVLEKWRGKEIPGTEGMILSTKKVRALKAAESAQLSQLPANLYLAEILREETEAIQALRKGAPKSEDKAPEPAPSVPGWMAALRRGKQQPDAPSDSRREEAEAKRPAPEPAREPERSDMAGLIQRTKKLQAELLKNVRGQDHAVGIFAAGYFQSELQAAIEKNRKRPRATFLFAGPPGVGKTFLSEEAARILELPFQRYDMSEYANANAGDELCGSDANYRASSEGLLTGFVNANPHCVLLIDEIEKANMDVLHLFLQVLDAGRLRDNRTDQEVSFKDAILIFTTNAGKALYSGSDTKNLSTLSRDVILDGLSKDINPRTGEPFFPGALCSRFASGNVVMFNHLDAHTLRSIVDAQLQQHISDLREAMGIEIDMAREVPTAILLSEGASADGRTAKGRADAFFGTELYELFRLINPENSPVSIDQIKTIRMTVDLEHGSDEIRKLFRPDERIHVLAYADAPYELEGDDAFVPVIHYVHSMEEAKVLFEREEIQLAFCDMTLGADAPKTDYLNREDFPSPARDFLYELLTRHPEIPVVLTESQDRPFTQEERTSYLRRGVWGFLSLRPEGLHDRICDYVDMIFQQNSLSSLARDNRLVRFETAQRVSADGVADIILFDMKLEKAIKTEDADNVMSMLSTPKELFDDVIGADDAKKELKFFINYMRNPKRYRKQGAAAPKGVLLYGPPGTGKTMLARTFAAESGATFIATEGNKFHKKFIGEGEELVHKIFATARRYAPSVVFIDEIDAVGSARQSGSTTGEFKADLLTALLTEMDGFSNDAKKPVFVLAATNFGVKPDDRLQLDEALLRRFDRRILVDLPNLENRKRFLKKMTDAEQIFHISERGIDSIAERSTGMSLALLRSMLDLAIRTAMQKGADRVEDKDLDEAFETFNGGEEKKWSPEITLRTARHEAGHTLISWLAGEKPSYVTIVSRGNFGGYMQHADQEERFGYTRQELLSRIRTSMGGRAAEIVCYGREDGISTGASGDLQTATLLAKHMLCTYGMHEDFGMAVMESRDGVLSPGMQRRINQILSEQLDEAVRLISDNRGKLDALVDELLKKSNLRGEEIDRALSGAEKA